MAKQNVMTRAKKQKAYAAFQQQNLAEARQLIKQVCQKDRRDAESFLLLGIISGMLNEFGEAENAFNQVIRLQPHSAAAYNNLGLILEGQGKTEEALQRFQKALSLDSHNADFYYNAANSFASLERHDAAIEHYQKSIALQADNVEAMVNLGNILQQQKKYTQAETLFHQALSINPRLPEAHYNLGNTYKAQSHFEAAKRCYLQAIKLKPDYQEAWNNLGNVYMAQSDVDDSRAAHQKVLALNPQNAAIASALVFSQSYLPSSSETENFQRHLDFAKEFAESLYPMAVAYRNDRAPDRRLKIGYVSPDLRMHPVATFFEPLLINHSTQQFETYAYSNGESEDTVTARLRSKFDHWRDIVRLPDQRVVEQIREDGIDILVDMAGHTAHNRLLVFAYRPAPVQVTWLGYGGTTGLKTMDYRIVDQYTTVEGDADQWHTEKLIRLPETFCCYQPVADAPAVGGLPAVKNGYVTFASFNNLAKLNDEVLSLWARVLQAVPASRLLLKSKGLDDEGTVNIIQQRCRDNGIDVARLTLQDADASYLEKYNQVDIALDPFPYNGGTTSFDACWMGVPLITLQGDSFYARMGLSINCNLGLSDLIAQDKNDYVAIAQRLSGDLKYLSEIRKGLRQRMQGSALTAGARFAQQMEAAYRDMWQVWCKKDS